MKIPIALISLITASSLFLAGCATTDEGSNLDPANSVESSETNTDLDVDGAGNSGDPGSPVETVEIDSEEELQEKNPDGGVNQVTTPGISSPMEFPIMVSLFSSSCNAARTSGMAIVSSDLKPVGFIASEQDKRSETVGFSTSSSGDMSATENLNDFDICLVSNVIDLIVNPEYTDLNISITYFEATQMELRVSGVALPTLSGKLNGVEHLDLQIGFDLDAQTITSIASKIDKDSEYSPSFTLYYGDSREYREVLELYDSVAG